MKGTGTTDRGEDRRIDETMHMANKEMEELRRGYTSSSSIGDLGDLTPISVPFSRGNSNQFPIKPTFKRMHSLDSPITVAETLMNKKSYHDRNLVARLLPETPAPDQVELLRVVIQDKSANLAQGDLKPCGHAEVASTIFETARPAVLQAAQRRCRCDLCESDTDIWLCLTCLGMFCSREGQGHGLKHYAETGHCVIMSLMSLNFWCYAHEQYLEHDFYPSLVPLFRAVHEIKHGVPAHIADMNRQSLSSGLGFSSSPQSAVCPHVDVSEARGFNPGPGFSLDSACKECGDTTERWVCLTCYETHCGRFANKHMIQHNNSHPGHDICLGIHDLSIWCQRCQQYLDTFKYPFLTLVFNYFYKLKFKGEDLPEPLTYQQDSLLSDFIFDIPLNGSNGSGLQ